MFEKSPSIKIFASIDWKKVIDISLIEYTVDKKDENWNNIPLVKDWIEQFFTKSDWTQVPKYIQESKWWRIKFEFTNDGWQNKKIIYLQDNEVVELISVLYWKQQSAKFQRNKPTVKTFTIENQWEHCFLKFQQNWENFYWKSSKFHSLNISTFWLMLLSKEIKREQWIQLPAEIILKQIELISSSIIQKPTSVQKITENQNSQENLTNSNPENIWNQENSSTCADCWTQLDPETHWRIIEFSNKKFKRTVCYNCQQKLK